MERARHLRLASSTTEENIELESIHSQNSYIIEQNKQIIDLFKSLNRKIHDTPTTTTLKRTISRRPNLSIFKGTSLAEIQHQALAEATTSAISAMFGMVSESSVEPKADRLSGPVQFFLKLMELWRLNSENACKLLGYELADIKYVEQVLSGVLPLRGRDPKDRIANLVVIRKRLDGLFKDVDVENEWLREKHADIGNKSPMELLLSGSMENLLLIKQFVEFVCGL